MDAGLVRGQDEENENYRAVTDRATGGGRRRAQGAPRCARGLFDVFTSESPIGPSLKISGWAC